MKSGRAKPWVMAVLTLLLAAAMVAGCLLGAVDFERGELWQSPIFWHLRLPRVMMSAVAKDAIVLRTFLARSGNFSVTLARHKARFSRQVIKPATQANTKAMFTIMASASITCKCKLSCMILMS